MTRTSMTDAEMNAGSVPGGAAPDVSWIADLLASAGVRIGGLEPWDIRVHDRRFFARIAVEGSLGAGESYEDGWWDCDWIDELSARMFRSGLLDRLRLPFRERLAVLAARLWNRQCPAAARRNAIAHYDLGNDFFSAMLGRRMVYSCAYWKGASTLDEAQEAKLDLISRKLGLKPGMTVLDVGCGWGGFASFAAERYGARVTGITLSPHQAALGQERCSGLPVEIRLQDYREVDGRFDRVVSVGMFEHVGFKNYGRFMKVVRRCLKEDGLFLLHTLGSNASLQRCDPWVDRHIFPGGMLPSIRQIGASIEGLFVWEDCQNLGAHYERTLLAWYENVERAWPAFRELYGDRMYRRWRLYLLGAAGFLRARSGQVWQIVLSPGGVSGGYEGVR